MKKSILKYFKAFTLIGVLASVTVLSSCGEDDGGDTVVEATENLLELIESTDGLDSLSKYLNRYPSLTGALSASAEYTFFAPNNDAFISLLETPGFPSSIELINPDIIEGVMAYHVVAGETVLEAEFTTDNTLTTLYTDARTATAQTISFNADGTLLTGSSNKNIEVATGDIRATNGIMHVVKSVLIPLSVEATLTPILGTNAGTILLGGSFTIFAEGITSADIFASENQLTLVSATLAGAAKHTVFAPTNATFESQQLTSASFTGQQWYGILMNSIVVDDANAEDTNEVIDQSEMTTGATFSTQAGGSLFFVNTTEPTNVPGGPGIYIDSDGDFDGSAATLNAEMALINAAVSANGTVHVIAGLCSPAAPQ